LRQASSVHHRERCCKIPWLLQNGRPFCSSQTKKIATKEGRIERHLLQNSSILQHENVFAIPAPKRVLSFEMKKPLISKLAAPQTTLHQPLASLIARN
jgi:hypothetical protein